MDLVTLVLELITSMLVLAIKPFSLIRLLCVLGVKSLCIVIQIWIELLRAAIGLHFSIIQNIVSWTYAIVSFPSRVVYAVQRESLIQSQLNELQIEIEKLIWSKKELEVRLQKSNRELKMMEAMLAELGDEHDEAIVKMEQLESKFKSIKEENLQLKEAHGKLEWSSHSADDSAKVKSSLSYGTRQQKPRNSSGAESRFSDPNPTYAVAPDHTLDVSTDDYLGHRAFLQSVFSSILSLLVGMIIWKADDPCMPLVMALYTVVGMSLKSVVQLFSTIENKPASDAVALVSLNWFILGALTYPTLPRIAYMLTPLGLRFGEKVVSWFETGRLATSVII